MTTHTAATRFMMTMVLATLLVLGLAPAASAQTEERRGWERTSTATGSSDSTRVTQSSGSNVSPDALRGWEATGVATGSTRGVATDDTPITTPAVSPSPTLLYAAAIVAALAMAFAAARMLRPHSGRHGVA